MHPRRPEAEAEAQLEPPGASRGLPAHRQQPSRRDSAARYASSPAGRRAPPWVACGTPARSERFTSMRAVHGSLHQKVVLCCDVSGVMR